jgi:hypothetical protein
MRALWSGIVDDAAVFPPGNAPLDVAVRRHDEHRAAAHADLVGPLLIPTTAVDDLAALTADRADPLAIGLVARPGVAAAEIEAALANALRCNTVEVTGVELGWTDGWRHLDLRDVPVVLEVPRGQDHDVALADLRAHLRDGQPVRAKLRTGPTPTWTWPDEAELADWLLAAAALEVPFKLTGGLHHAVRGRYTPFGASEEENHGLLNVLLAVHAAADGSSADHVRRLLEVRDAQDLADLLRAWDDDAVRLTRSLLTAFGCCEVADPVTELTDLDLLSKD